MIQHLTSQTPLLVATHNQHKLTEFKRLLPEWTLHSLNKYHTGEPPVEDADTFIGNALIKARSAWKQTGILSLADDSGLEVDALGGQPGIYSARYVDGSDQDRTLAILNALKDQKIRTARFRCALVLVGLAPDLLSQFSDDSQALAYRFEDALVSVGVLEGHISDQIYGNGGFGYDPIFKINQNQTVAELSDIKKDLISHRGKACRKMNDLIKKNLTF
jgi:XTP/dITP diphosphohydrolase